MLRKRRRYESWWNGRPRLEMPFKLIDKSELPKLWPRFYSNRFVSHHIKIHQTSDQIHLLTENNPSEVCFSALCKFRNVSFNFAISNIESLQCTQNRETFRYIQSVASRLFNLLTELKQYFEEEAFQGSVPIRNDSPSNLPKLLSDSPEKYEKKPRKLKTNKVPCAECGVKGSISIQFALDRNLVHFLTLSRFSGMETWPHRRKKLV